MSEKSVATKDKVFRLRLSLTQRCKLSDDAKAAGYESESAYVVSRLWPERGDHRGDAIPYLSTGGPVRAGMAVPDLTDPLLRVGETGAIPMSEVKAMPQSDRVALAKSLVTRPHSLGQVNRGARNTKCQHGLEFDRCEPCYEEVNGVGSYPPERKD